MRSNPFKLIPRNIRYEIIYQAYKTTQLSPQMLSNIFDVTPKTIINAINRMANNVELPTQGRPKLLKEHHKVYIQARTISNRNISNKQLALELKNVFPDLKDSKLNASTVGRFRNSIGLFYLPVRRNCAITEESRLRRIHWCQEQQALERVKRSRSSSVTSPGSNSGAKKSGFGTIIMITVPT